LARISRKAAKLNNLAALCLCGKKLNNLVSQNLSNLEKKKNRLSLAKKDGIYN